MTATITRTLTADALLFGAGASVEVTVPGHVLWPARDPGDGASAGSTDGPVADPADHPAGAGVVVMRPLVLSDVQLIAQAAKENAELTAVLMVQRALVDPAVTIDQVARMHAGLVEFLLGEVNRISGLQLTGDELDAMVRAPLGRAAFVLAREFGWTPEQCSALTVGQILLYLEMLGRGNTSVRGSG